MTFDDQIKRAFDTLTERLRDEMSRQAQSTIDELAGSARAERDTAVAEARAQAERAAGDGLASAVADAEARGRDQARDEYERQLRERDEREQRERNERDERDRTQRERDQLDREQREREEREREERERELHRVAEPVNAQAAADAALGRLADAFRAIDRARSLTEILDTLVSCAGREAARAGVWLVRASSFSGWRFTGFEPGFNGSSSFEAGTEEGSVLAAALRNSEQAGGSAATGAAPSFAGLPPESEAVAVPITMNGQVVAVLYADRGLPTADSGLPTTDSRLSTDTIELLARHAARCLEALTAFKAARALLDRPGASTAPPEAAAGDETNGGEDASARRYARLIVSEIKLYHEEAVVAGRRERDLATRLGDEIGRARALYEQRVPAHVREHTDYFHDELVQTLANGDPSLLEVGSMKFEV
jgi:hypothetical protein